MSTLSDLIRNAQMQMRPQGSANPFAISPGYENVQPGYPGSGGIRAPGMKPGGLPPGFEQALLQEATRTTALPAGGRLPEAAQTAPLTREEQELGLRAEISPGSTPYLPIQAAAPSVPGIERMKAMNLSMTPEGMAEHFRQLGFEATTFPSDKFADYTHPLHGEIVSGEGYNIAIKEPTTGQWHTLDPQSFEAADLTDILSDAAITVSSIMGANVAGASRLAAKQTAAAQARRAALDAAKRRGLIQTGGRAGQMRAPAHLAETAKRLGMEAATPTTYTGARVGAAMGWTVPPEAARQTLAAALSGTEPGQVPEEGAGPRIGRGILELGASAVGEALDPVMGFKALWGMRGRRQIKAWQSAKAAGASSEELANMPLPKEFKGVAEEDLVGRMRHLAGEEPEIDDVGIQALGGKGAEAAGIVDSMRESGRTWNLKPAGGKPLDVEEGAMAGAGPVVMRLDREGREIPYVRGDYTHAGEDLQVPGMSGRGNYLRDLPPELVDGINKFLESDGRTIAQLSSKEWKLINEEARSYVYGTGMYRNPAGQKGYIPPMQSAFPAQRGQSTPGLLDRIAYKANSYSGKPAPYDLARDGILAKEGVPHEVQAHREAFFRHIDEMDDNELFGIGFIRKTNENDISDLTRAVAAEGEGGIITLVNNLKSRAGHIYATRSPLFQDKAGLKGVLDNDIDLIREMDWVDVVREADNWEIDANLLREAQVRGTDAAKWETMDENEAVFRYILENAEPAEKWKGMEGHDRAITPYEPSAKGHTPHDLVEKNLVPVWGKYSESPGLAREGATDPVGLRNNWHLVNVDGVDFVAREHITAASPAPAMADPAKPRIAYGAPISTRPVPLAEEFDAARSFGAQRRPTERTSLTEGAEGLAEDVVAGTRVAELSSVLMGKESPRAQELREKLAVLNRRFDLAEKHLEEHRISEREYLTRAGTTKEIAEERAKTLRELRDELEAKRADKKGEKKPEADKDTKGETGPGSVSRKDIQDFFEEDVEFNTKTDRTGQIKGEGRN